MIQTGSEDFHYHAGPARAGYFSLLCLTRTLTTHVALECGTETDVDRHHHENTQQQTIHLN